MNHARLDDGLGEDRLDRLGEALQPVDAADQDVPHAALLEIAQDLHPELRALGLLKPHPEHVAIAVDGDAQREVAGAALDAASLADLQHQAVEEHDRVDVLQRPLRPRADVVHDRVGDAADQITADLHAVDLLQVRPDVSDRQPARVERQDLVVEAHKAALALAHDPRLKRAVAIPGRVDPHRPVLGRERLRRRAVARVARPAGRLLMRLVAQVLGQLDVHRPLHQPLGQLREHATGPDDLPLAARAREQLVDHLVSQPTTRGQLADRRAQPRAIDRLLDQLRGELPTAPGRGTPRRGAQRFARVCRVAGAVARPGSHRTVLVLFTHGSSGRRVANPAAGRFIDLDLSPLQRQLLVGGGDDLLVRAMVQLHQRDEPAVGEKPGPQCPIDLWDVAQRPQGPAPRVDALPC